MKKFAKTDFYRGLADLTRGFLETDLELIGELVSEEGSEEDSEESAQA